MIGKRWSYSTWRRESCWRKIPKAKKLLALQKRLFFALAELCWKRRGREYDVWTLQKPHRRMIISSQGSMSKIFLADDEVRLHHVCYKMWLEVNRDIPSSCTIQKLIDHSTNGDWHLQTFPFSTLIANVPYGNHRLLYQVDKIWTISLLWRRENLKTCLETDYVQA